MACVSGALRPCVLPRGAFLSVCRCHSGRTQSAAKALCSQVYGITGIATSTKWNSPRASTLVSPSSGFRTNEALFSVIHNINHELLSSTYSSKSFSTKAVAGDSRPSTTEPDFMWKEGEEETPEDSDNPTNWTIKLLYDGDCPLCMKEVEFLRERNKTYRKIKLVDINAESYSQEENAGVSYAEAMGLIHGILRDGTILKGVAVFKKVYEEVGLGWVYAITSIGPIGKVADSLYDLWAKYRLPVTGRPPLLELLEARRQKKAALEECETDGCKMEF